MNPLNSRYLAEMLRLTDNDFLVEEDELTRSKSLILQAGLESEYNPDDREDLRRYAIKRHINNRVLINLWDQCSGDAYNKNDWNNVWTQLAKCGLIPH